MLRSPKTYLALWTKKFALSIAAIPYRTFRTAAIMSMTPAKVTSPWPVGVVVVLVLQAAALAYRPLV